MQFTVKKPLFLTLQFPIKLETERLLKLDTVSSWFAASVRDALAYAVGASGMNGFDTEPIHVVIEKTQRDTVLCDVRRTDFGKQILDDTVMPELQASLVRYLSQKLSRLATETRVASELRVNIDCQLRGKEVEVLQIKPRERRGSKR